MAKGWRLTILPIRSVVGTHNSFCGSPIDHKGQPHNVRHTTGMGRIRLTSLSNFADDLCKTFFSANNTNFLDWSSRSIMFVKVESHDNRHSAIFNTQAVYIGFVKRMISDRILAALPTVKKGKNCI